MKVPSIWKILSSLSKTKTEIKYSIRGSKWINLTNITGDETREKRVRQTRHVSRALQANQMNEWSDEWSEAVTDTHAVYEKQYETFQRV